MNDVHNQGDAHEPDAILQLWGLRSAPVHGPRARADVPAVARAAVAVADRDGMNAVTIQTVAAELGLTPTALYRYVDSKATLIELMVDAALGAAPDLGSGTAPERISDWVHALWQRYETHPWLATFAIERPPRTPNAMSWLHELVIELDRDGSADPLGAALAIDVLVRGYAGLASVATGENTPSTELRAEFSRRFPALKSGAGRDRDIQIELLDAIARHRT